MQLKKVVDMLELTLVSGEEGLEKEVDGGYLSDLLSDVIAHSQKGDLWITLQVHQNTVAVAVLKELAGIVIVGSKTPAEDTLKKAKEKNVTLLTTTLPAFEVAGRLYALGLRGKG